MSWAEMGYVALKRLKWGSRFIEPGEPVPEGEVGRDYASLVFHDQIGPLKEASEMSDAELAEANERLTAERDSLAEQLAADTTPVDVPDDVTPGEAAGWPINAVTGGPLALTDEQRSTLAEEGVSGTAIVTHDGDFVVIDGPDKEVDVPDDKTGDRVEIKKPEDPGSVEKSIEPAKPKAKAKPRAKRS